jgi:hypothetical protein
MSRQNHSKLAVLKFFVFGRDKDRKTNDSEDRKTNSSDTTPATGPGSPICSMPKSFDMSYRCLPLEERWYYIRWRQSWTIAFD